MKPTVSKGKVRCVIYDCDGVLFDSIETNRRFYNHICTSVGRVFLSEPELRYVHTHTLKEAIHFLLKEDPVMEAKAFEFVRRIDPMDFIPYLKMEPNLLPALSALRKQKILRAINTNRTTSMKHIMARFDLWPYFDMVVTALDVKNPKPHPESIEKIMATFTLKRKETVFVGDSEVDKQTAESAGIIFIAYKNKEIAKDLYIDDHLSLLTFLAHGRIAD